MVTKLEVNWDFQRKSDQKFPSRPNVLLGQNYPRRSA